MDRHQWLNEFVLCITLSGVTVAVDLTIEFLGGVPRFRNNTGYTDYYVYCGAVGQFVGWEVGTDRLAGFGASDVARAIVDTRSAYEYTATLLSSQPLPGSDQHRMDSIIMVTFIGVTPSSFEVTCTSVTDIYTSRTILVPGNISAVLDTNYSSHYELVLDYVLKSRMQNEDFVHIFVCGTRDKQQFYEVENSRIGFSVQDRVGRARPIQSSDGNTETGFGIFVAEHPYRITSVIFIFGNSGVTVVCLDGNHRVQVSSDNNPATSPISKSSADTSTSNSPNPTGPPVSSISSTLTTPPPSPDNMTSTLSPNPDNMTLTLSPNPDNITSTLSPNPDNMTSTLSLTTEIPGGNFHIFIAIIIPAVVVVVVAAILLPSCICCCCCKCYRRGKYLPNKNDSPKKNNQDDPSDSHPENDSPKKNNQDDPSDSHTENGSPKKNNQDDPSDSHPAQKETAFGTNCSKSGGSSFPNGDPSKKIDSEENDSEGYASGGWSASEDGFSDDELLRKLIESRVSDRQEQWRYLHHFVCVHNRSYTYDNLMFIKDSKSSSKITEISIVVDGHTKEIQDAVNDVVFVRPSKILRVYFRRVMPFSIADGLKQEVQDNSSSSSKAVYISCSSETNSSKVAVSTGSPDVIVCKENPNVATVAIAAGNPFKIVRVLSKNDNVCVMKEGYVLENEESLTVEGNQYQSEEGSKVISSEELQLQPVKNLEKRISMVVQGAGDLTGGSGACLLPGMLEGNTSAIIGTCWYNKRAVLIVGEGVRCQIVLNVYKDKEAGSQGESPEGLINTPKMVTVQQVMTKKLVANDFDYWMQVIHCHVLHKRKTHSSLVHALVSQDASLKTHSLSCRMPGYFNLGPHHQHPYLKLSKDPQQDNRQRILSDSSNQPMSTGRSSRQKTRLQYHQQQQYFHEGQFYNDSFQMAIGVEGGKAGSAGTIEDRLKTKMTPGVQVSDPNILDIMGPTNLLVVNELCPFPLPPGKVHRLVQPCSLKVATSGWGQVAKTRNFSK